MQTAINYLVSWMSIKQKDVLEHFIEEAIKMEKKQIIDAHSHNRCTKKQTFECSVKAINNAEKYFAETYGSKGSDDAKHNL